MDNQRLALKEKKRFGPAHAGALAACEHHSCSIGYGFMLARLIALVITTTVLPVFHFSRHPTCSLLGLDPKLVSSVVSVR
jgi:hypothetical protein